MHSKATSGKVRASTSGDKSKRMLRRLSAIIARTTRTKSGQKEPEQLTEQMLETSVTLNELSIFASEQLLEKLDTIGEQINELDQKVQKLTAMVQNYRQLSALNREQFGS